MTRIVLTGDSHLGSLRRASDADQTGRFSEFSFLPLGRGGIAPTKFFEYDESAKTVTITNAEWRNVTFSLDAMEPNGDKALLVVSLPLNSSRVLRDYSWNTHVPWHLKANSSEIALSEAVVETIFEQDCGNSISFLQALNELGINVVALEGPRFFENARYLRNSRFDVIKYVEASFRTHVRKRLSDLGINCVSQPDQTISKDGCTLLKFDHENPRDVHHANQEFGGIMLNSILEYASHAL